MKDDDGNAAVAKFVTKEPGAERELLMGDSLKATEARNVIPVLDIGEHNNKWVIVMPKADRSLLAHLQSAGGPLPVSEAVDILTDIATALADLAAGDPAIVHRDLKPGNVLRLDGRWCLADFGIARYAEATTGPDTRKWNLTRPYAAPEQWQLERATAATDVYAFGVMAYEMLSGHLPFPGPDFRQQHLTLPAPTLTSATPRLRTLIEECLYRWRWRGPRRPTSWRDLSPPANSRRRQAPRGLPRRTRLRADVSRVTTPKRSSRLSETKTALRCSRWRLNPSNRSRARSLLQWRQTRHWRRSTAQANVP